MKIINSLVIGLMFLNCSFAYSQTVTKDNFFDYLINKRKSFSTADIKYDRYELTWKNMKAYRKFLSKIENKDNVDKIIDKTLKKNKKNLAEQRKVECEYAFKTEGSFPYEMEYM